MKIVYCHSYYQHRGGEDVSFESDLVLLRQEGHEVIPFTRDNMKLNDKGSLEMVSDLLFNRDTYHDMLEMLEAERPDILHCNNLFPLISTSVYRAAKKLKIPVVQALRNYRTFCANSFFFRNDRACTKCLHSSASWQGIRHACYRGSRLATTAIVMMQYYHRLARIHNKYVDAFFTPTNFAREIFMQGGFDPQSLFVRCNFLTPDPGPRQLTGRYALFIGRLSDEKGVETLINAWQQRNINLPLHIVGDGPAETKFRKQAEGNSQIVFLGHLNAEAVSKQIESATVLIAPSLWYETFGRTLVEAFAQGVPVIASRLGAMNELVKDGESGFLFETGDSGELANAVEKIQSLSTASATAMSKVARQTYERRFTSLHSYEQLLKVYEFATRNHASHSSVASLLAETQQRLDNVGQSWNA